jgi:hypothetical protein
MADAFPTTARRLSRTLFAMALALSVAVTTEATADPMHTAKAKPAAAKSLAQTLTGQAKADYDAAKLLYGDGDYVGALIKFQRAYDAAQDARLFWNIAACQKALRHYSKVIVLLKRYIGEGGSLVTAGDARDAQDLISAIEPFTAKLTVNVSEDAAAVSVDGESLGASPVSPVVVDIGERHVHVAKEGFLPFEKAIPIGGAEATVDVKLEKEIHEGRLTVNAPAAATVLLDDKPIGKGKTELSVLSGGHQLRITAPGMRPYQSEVVIQDRETRTVDVALEALELPRLRVAVGCGDPEPKSPDDGLVAYLDGNDVLPSSGVMKSWNPDRNDNVFRYAEYPVAAGPHSLRLRVKGCKSVERGITIDPTVGDDVDGALELDKNILLKGPQGSPGWGRVGAAFWMPTLLAPFSLGPDNYSGHAGSFAGAAADVGLVLRWFSADLALGYAKGSLTRSTFTSNYALPGNTSSDIVRGMLRFGPRFPFNVASFGFGVGVGLEQINVDGVKTGGVDPAFQDYAELVVQPFCSVGFFAMGDFTVDVGQAVANGNSATFLLSLQVGVTFEPSSACMKERGTVFGLREKSAQRESVLTPAPSVSLPPTPATPAPPASLPAPAPPPPAPQSSPAGTTR